MSEQVQALKNNTDDIPREILDLNRYPRVRPTRFDLAIDSDIGDSHLIFLHSNLKAARLINRAGNHCSISARA